jgi:hypothetical protein
MDQHTRQTIVEELASLLTKGYAHCSVEEACADIPPALLNQRVPEVPYTIWELAEHIRIAQWDILEFSRSANYESPQWPEGYWPDRAVPANEAAFQTTVAQIGQDRQAFVALLRDPKQDLLTPLAHGTGQSLLREAMLIADHNAYHLGQLILVRRLLGIWE